MKTLTGILAGVSGEYFVAKKLSRRGYVASLTLRNTRGIDILASKARGMVTSWQSGVTYFVLFDLSLSSLLI
jgi:hypothetical protein